MFEHTYTAGRMVEPRDPRSDWNAFRAARSRFFETLAADARARGAADEPAQPEEGDADAVARPA